MLAGFPTDTPAQFNFRKRCNPAHNRSPMGPVPRVSNRSTAIHEAGHAVIGRVLGLTCDSATIIPNEDEREAGHALIADPWKTHSDWEQAVMEGVERGEPPVKY